MTAQLIGDHIEGVMQIASFACEYPLSRSFPLSALNELHCVHRHNEDFHLFSFRIITLLCFSGVSSEKSGKLCPRKTLPLLGLCAGDKKKLSIQMILIGKYILLSLVVTHNLFQKCILTN